MGGAAGKLQPDGAALLAIGGNGRDWVHLLTIAEGHLQPEGAIGGQGHDLLAHAQRCCRIGGPVDNQLGIGHQPEAAWAGHQASTGFVAPASPKANTRGLIAGRDSLVGVQVVEGLGSPPKHLAATAGLLVEPLMQACRHRRGRRDGGDLSVLACGGIQQKRHEMIGDLLAWSHRWHAGRRRDGEG